MNDKKLYAFFVAFLILFSLTVGIAVFRNPIKNISQAGQDVVDVNQSVTIVDKLEATAPSDTVQITVFVRNKDGRELDNKPVQLSTTLGTFSQNNLVTDKYGKAVFRLTSRTAGQATVTGTIESQPMTQPLSIKFSNKVAQ